MKRKPLSHRDVQTVDRPFQAARDDLVHGVVGIAVRPVESVRPDQDELIRQFAHEHGPALRKVARRMVGREDGDDVAQEAFVNLLNRIRAKSQQEVTELLHSPHQLVKLMYTITARRAFDHLRRKRRRRDELTEDGAPAESRLGEPGTLHQHVSIEIRRLARAYELLPPIQRIVHVLHHHCGFTDADLEVTLGISKTNSRTLVHRANETLIRAMEKNQ
jgi:RNA polymerase sigma factor (sigma-70 family)